MPEDLDENLIDEMGGEYEVESILPPTLSPFASAILGVHNGLRSNTSLTSVGLPPADPPLPLLTWNNAIAATAQAWADQHLWGHSPGAYRYSSNGYAAGENIFIILSYSAGLLKTCSTDNASPGEAASNGWGKERFNPSGDWTGPYQLFPFAGGSDGSGVNVIGHYTQMIWGNMSGPAPTTTQMGCGLSGFYNPSYGRYQCTVVCQYHGPGNFIGSDAYQH